jgi:hypothetical protein
MASCGKKYEVMPARYPKEMVLASLGEQLGPMYEIAPAVGAAVANTARAAGLGFGAGAGAGITGADVNLSAEKMNELDVNPTDKLHQGLAKILNKDPDQYGVSELFSELESMGPEQVKMADALHDVYSRACKAKGEEPMNFKESKEDNIDSFLDDIVEDMVTEEIAGTSVEEAEVVMAARALSNDIQDHIERLGRMVNEDIPAIADSMSHEFGLDKAQSFKTGMEELLASTLDANKACKDGIDNILGGITGEGSVADAPVGDMGSDDMAMDEPALDDVPMDDFDGADAEAGPLEEPLGRLEKE